jgi:tRNA(Ile)-lysidine synthase
LYILNNVKKEYNLKLYVAHFNHKLRGKSSEEDAKFVSKLANSYGLDFIKGESDTRSVAELRRGGLEKVAREERYVFFIKTAISFGINKIALAHNKDDNIETVIHRFIKGSGAQGLSGIPAIRKICEGEFGIKSLPFDIYIIRPLINEYKSSIIEYFKKMGIKYRIDASNYENVYDRNKIRNILIPLIEKKFNLNFKENISNLAILMGIENDFLQRESEKEARKIIKIQDEGKVLMNIKALKKLHPAIRLRVIRASLQMIFESKRKITFVLIRNIENFIMGKKHVNLPEDIKCIIENDKIIFERVEEAKEEISRITIEKITGVDVYKFGGKKIKFSVVKNTGKFNLKEKRKGFIDSEKVKFPIIIRRRKQGDRFIPYGMNEKVRLKKYLISAKIKEEPILVCDSKSIMWVAGSRIDERYKIENNTKRILIMELIK